MSHSFFWPAAVLLALFACPANAQKGGSPSEILYAGTFSQRESQGIYVFQFSRGSAKLTEIQTLADKESPSFMALHPNKGFLYAVYREGKGPDDKNGTATAFRIDKKTGKLQKLNEQPVTGQDPCHIVLDPKSRFVYVSNYSSGNVTVLPVQPGGGLGPSIQTVQHEGSSVNPDRQKSPHAHSAVFDKAGRFLYVSDLGTDKIMIYAADPKTGRLTPATQPFAQTRPGAGPRHFTFLPNGRYAYAAAELSSEVEVFKVDKRSGALSPVQQISMLPGGFGGDSFAADIHTSPDGKFLYASNRGHDSIVIYSVDPATGRLTLVGHEPTRGGHPRNFHIEPKGEYVFVANRDKDNIAVFRRNRLTGKLSFTESEAKVPAAVFVALLKL